MLKSYFKIARRNITKHKVFSLINVLGLAIGICGFLVISLIVQYDLSFDNFQPDKGRIFRIVGDLKTASGEDIDFNKAPYSLQLTLQQDVAGIENVAGFYPIHAKISVANIPGEVKIFNGKPEDGNWWTSVIVANQNYFSIFKYDWLAGDEGTALDQPYKVVITLKKAHQYFGEIPCDKMLGREIKYNDSVRVQVSGIIKD